MGSNVVLIGKIADYQSNFNLINMQIQKGILNILGWVLEESNYETIDDIPVYSSYSEIKDLDFDYFILLTENKEYYNSISVENNFKQKIIPIRVFNLPFFDFEKYQKLLENPPSIISRHCWGGIVYHSLGLQFRSPFVNLFLHETDFNKLAKNFSYYMNKELEYIQEGFDPILKTNYPIVRLGDLTLYFNHYSTFEEAKTKWDERKKRINYDNLFFETTTELKSVALQFKSLDLERKICFCVDDIEGKGMINCVDTIPEFRRGKLGMFVNGTATGEIPYFDLIDLLLNYNYTSRIKVPQRSDKERAYSYYKTTNLYELEYTRFFGLDEQVPWELNDNIQLSNFIENLGINHPKIYYKLDNISDLKKIENNLPTKFFLKSSYKTSSNMVLLKKFDDNHFVDEFSSKKYTIDEIINENINKFNSVKEINPYFVVEEYIGNFLPNLKVPLEYKIFCFNGIPKIILQTNKNNQTYSFSLFDGTFIPLHEGRDWFIDKTLAEVGIPIIPPNAYKILAQSIKISQSIGDKLVIIDWFDNAEEPVFKGLTFASKELFTGMFSLSREIILNLNTSLDKQYPMAYIEKGYRVDETKFYNCLSQELNFYTSEYDDLLNSWAEGNMESLEKISSYFKKVASSENDEIKKRLYQHLEIAWLETLLLYDELLTENLCRQIRAGWGFVFLKTIYHNQRINEANEILYHNAKESDWYKIRWAQFILDLSDNKAEISQAKEYVNTYSEKGMDYALSVKEKYDL